MHISKQLKVKNKLAAKSFFRTSEVKLIKFLNIFTTWNPIGTTLFVHGNPKNRDQEAEEKKEKKKEQAILASRVVKTLPKIRIQRHFFIFETLTNFTTLAE